MSKRYQILVVGGGTAGIMVASSLLRKNPKLHLAIIEPSESHWYQPIWTLVGAGSYSYRKSQRPMKSVIPKQADRIQDKVVSIDAENNRLTTEKGKEYQYEYLVMAAGLKLDPSLTEGLPKVLGKGVVCSNYTNPTHTWDVIKNFNGGTALFMQPPKPYKCGGAPQKIMYLADDYFRRRGIRKKTNVVFASAADSIFAVPEIAKTLWKVIGRKNVNVKFQHELKKVDGENRIAWFKVAQGFEEHNPTSLETLEKDGLVGIKYDMLHVVPINTPPDFIKGTNLVDENYWFDVHPGTLQHKKFKNVFGLGDVSNLPTSKTGAAIRKQAPVVVENVLSLIKSNQLSTKAYDGYSSCPFITGYGKMVLAEFDYSKKFLPDPKLKRLFIKDSSKEHWRLWILKKYILPYLYWTKMLRGKEV